jgi:hypothetical protein
VKFTGLLPGRAQLPPQGTISTHPPHLSPGRCPAYEVQNHTVFNSVLQSEGA